MHLLEKKLEIAQKEQRKVESEMEQLVSELDAVKLRSFAGSSTTMRGRGGRRWSYFWTRGKFCIG